MISQTPVPLEHNDDGTRSLDPNVLQRRASNPETSVWVSASAGTGKTKVLTDRVLRLLLPNENGDAGCAPHKILGLTFTKAAANEMALRINETLSEWTILPLTGQNPKEKNLTDTLKNLLGRAPNNKDIAAARKLFADVIDTPGRLKIMTIHSFCQSLLARFPLEAKITPDFKLIEERAAKDYLTLAKHRVFKTAALHQTNPINTALINISRSINEDQLSQIITSIASERGQLENILQQNFSIDGFYTTLCQTLQITPNQSPSEILRTVCADEAFDKTGLKSCADAMENSGKNDQETAAKIYNFLASNIQSRITYFNEYKSAFFTQKNTQKAKLIAKPISDKEPHLLDIMQAEAKRIGAMDEAIKSINMASFTRDILLLGSEILKAYKDIKTKYNVLDYDDLIFKTRDLLHSNSQWVHYKLDEGIDHILIDEAQDTNPDQWKIIETLCAEFFPEHSRPEKHRTIFTVGDEKQSIYSFQRASPEEFDRMRNFFAQKINGPDQKLEPVDLNISFRSTKSILAAVDAVFADPQIHKGLGIKDIKHDAFRTGQAGLVELWPLFENDDKSDDDETITWDPPITITTHKTAATKSGEAIADQIKLWLDSKEILQSHDRPIQPRDIMILVRTRNAFVAQLIRALKTRKIPVGGLDRIILNEQLAVQDMLAASEFALLPQDDLTLACLLKSPLIGMNEDDLFALSYNRNTSLWNSVRQNADKAIITYLRDLQHHAKTLSPYAFYANILQSPCPSTNVLTGSKSRSGLHALQKRLGMDALDALDELLNAALTFEKDNTPSLQNFLHWQRGGAADIKRQNNDQNNQVRIMTVHGSKGLQAPIVFLPDTTSTPGLNATNAGNRLLWPTQTSINEPLWVPRSEDEPAYYTTAKDHVKDRMGEEYRRLLYVAMTRAEERLYITGNKGARDISDDCWYALIKNGLQNHANHEILENGTIRLQNTKTKDADKIGTEQYAPHTHLPIPHWLYEQAPTEPHPPTPLMPSRPSETVPSALSPLKADDNFRFRRGNVTHTLLQFLPDLPPQNREHSAQKYVHRHAADLPQPIRDDIITETLNILNNPQFFAIFGKDSRAEVPITGLLNDGRLISGQIDRLLITDSHIMIIDFKSNRPPPTDPNDIPKIYQNQLQSYADVLKTIYPHHEIRAALLWTDGPNLMPVQLV